MASTQSAYYNPISSAAVACLDGDGDKFVTADAQRGSATVDDITIGSSGHRRLFPFLQH